MLDYSVRSSLRPVLLEVVKRTFRKAQVYGEEATTWYLDGVLYMAFALFYVLHIL